MVKIILKEHEDIDTALQRFKNLCRRDGYYEEISRKQYYIKPSLKEHMKQQKARGKTQGKSLKAGGSKRC